ncbi:polysaccharide biosynthesis C-terminal domain-containing protein, partial [Vibrio parahaemolyticus]|nr:polysaccharide biosynthesis C-terminal domain-containing protein [Vibrio parahaemolyticus]
MWWVFDVSDRWLILYFLDKQAVGIYSMACKIAGLLLIIHTIIFQTWQVFAIKNYRSSNSKEGYDKFTKFYFLIIFISASFLMSISGLIFDYLFSSSYVDSWVVSNYLIIGSVFFSISSYFGVYYVVVGKTKRALSTSMLAAILNIFLNLVFIPKIGLKGAVIATVISNLFLMAVRAKDTKKLISTEHGYYLLTTLILCLLVQLYLSTAFPIYISLIIPFSLIFCLIMAWRSEGNSRI